MADKIVILRDGYIEQIGSPLDVYDMPANLFVAEFIGSPAMNMFRGKVSGSSCVIAEGVKLPLPARHGLRDGLDIVYGIRPEHLTLDKGVKAKVSVLEPTGPETHIYADIAGQEVCAITQERVSLARGDDLNLAPRPGKVHLFDAASGKRL